MGAADDPLRQSYDEDASNFRLGEDADKERFIKKHGIDAALDVLEQEINATSALRGGGTGGSKFHDELIQWRERLLERKGEKRGVPMSRAASALGVG